MRIDDFIVFGRTVPERSKKYGHSVCAAGYSFEMNDLIRIYPLRIKSKVKARKKLSLEVERNKDDTRHESWAIKNRTENNILDTNENVSSEQLQKILENNLSRSITELNNNKKSLGIIKAEDFSIILKTKEEIQEEHIFNDFINGFKTGKDYQKVPYLKMKLEGRNHCIQMREWGIFELIRKYGVSISANGIQNSLHIDPNKTTYFIIGNMYQFRNNWLVIKTFTFTKSKKSKSPLKGFFY